MVPVGVMAMVEPVRFAAGILKANVKLAVLALCVVGVPVTGMRTTVSL
jgi:hypothetical protein